MAMDHTSEIYIREQLLHLFITFMLLDRKQPHDNTTLEMKDIECTFIELQSLKKMKDKSAGVIRFLSFLRLFFNIYFLCSIVGSKARAKYSRVMTKTNKKAQLLVTKINEWHQAFSRDAALAERTSSSDPPEGAGQLDDHSVEQLGSKDKSSQSSDEEADSEPFYTIEMFNDGFFPWQTTGKNGTRDFT